MGHPLVIEVWITWATRHPLVIEVWITWATRRLREEDTVVSLRTFAEASGIFIVSMIVLFLFYMATEKKATGIGWLQWKGYVLMGVGVLYLLSGVVLTRLR